MLKARIKTSFQALLLFWALAAEVPCLAQVYKPVRDIAVFKENFKRESAKVETIESDFTQEKHLLALTEKVTSTGKFWFKRSNKVRIDYEKPFLYRLIINGDKMLVKDDQQENRVNVKSNKLFQQVNRIMVDCIQGSIMDNTDFTSNVVENEQFFQLQMTPRSKALKEFFQLIVLTVDKADYSASALEMIEPSGDKTVLKFNNKTVNKSINEEVFRL
jgi:outer membrane lipoprotein-sorting protein